MRSRTLRSIERRPPRSSLAAAAFALALAAATAAAAGTVDGDPATTTAAAPEERPTAAATAAGSGLVAFIDPATGELTSEPSREQVEALEAALKTSLSRSTDGLETFELTAGGRGVHLAGRFRTATVVRRQTDGSFALLCVDRPDEAAGWVGSPVPGTPAWEEK